MVFVPRGVPQEKTEAQPQPSAELSKGEVRVLDEVDRILDKISAEGMSALTDEERKILDDVSRKHRSN